MSTPQDRCKTMTYRIAAAIAILVIYFTICSPSGFTSEHKKRQKASANAKAFAASNTVQRKQALGYIASGNIAQAESTFAEILKLQRAFPKKYTKLEIARTLHDLGDCSSALHQYSVAEQNYLESLSLLEKVKAGGSQRQLLADTLHSLSKLYSEQGEYAKAEPYLKRALSFEDQAKHADLADSYDQYAQILLKLNRPVDASAARQEANQHRKKHAN